ncbi:MAG: histidine kinase [Burkholderiaceae bacterium]
MSASPPDLQATTTPAESRPASLWPAHTGPGEGPRATDFAASLLDESPVVTAARQRERVAELYDLCRPTLVLRVVLFVQFGVALGGLVASAGPMAWLTNLAVLAFPALAGTLLWLATVCALRPLWPRVGPWHRAAVAIALGAAMGVGGWALLLPLGMAVAAAWPAASAALVGAVFAALVWTWLDQRAKAARPADASARLAELQSRIRPHFLFNALNTAVALVQIDPERAERVLEDLAELFRVALAEVGASVTLGEEIDLAKRYLAIEQIRFGERLAVRWDVDPAAAGARVPPLVLQPLVENAVRHGIEASLRGGHVSVKATARHGTARVVVSNSLPDLPSTPGAGIALANVRERLSLLHDIGASLDTWRGDGQFHARVTVPL